MCCKLHETSTTWPFIKDVYNEDDSKFYWVCDNDDVSDKVSGPFEDIDKAVEAAGKNDDAPPVTPLGLGQLKIAARRVKDNTFVKVYKGKTGYYWCGNSLEGVPENFMHGPFNSKNDAVYKATRETSFKRLLLNKCQEEFEKENIFDEVCKENSNKLCN